MTDKQAGRPERCPRCNGSRIIQNPAWTETNAVYRKFIQCPDCKDAPTAASTGTPMWRRQESCPECDGDGCNYCFPGPAPTVTVVPAPSEPGSAEQFYDEWDGMIEAEGMVPQSVFRFAESYAGSLRAQLQEREREIVRLKSIMLRTDIDEAEKIDNLEATIQRLRKALTKVIDCCPFIPGERLHDAITEAEAALAQPGAGKDLK